MVISKNTLVKIKAVNALLSNESWKFDLGYYDLLDRDMTHETYQGIFLMYGFFPMFFNHIC